MSKHNEQSIKQAIQSLLKTYGLEQKLNEVKLVSLWEKVMGKMIANHTKNIYVQNKCLFLKLDSAALKHELTYAKSKIITMMNDEMGVEVILDIVIQ